MENQADLTIDMSAEPQELALRLRHLRGCPLACGYVEFISAFNPFRFSSVEKVVYQNFTRVNPGGLWFV